MRVMPAENVLREIRFNGKGDTPMNSYVISCCSTADLSKEHFEARDISYICFHYELNGKLYSDDLGQSMPFDQF